MIPIYLNYDEPYQLIGQRYGVIGLSGPYKVQKHKKFLCFRYWKTIYTTDDYIKAVQAFDNYLKLMKQ